MSAADRNGRKIDFDYDGASRLVGVTLPDKGRVVYSYGTNGYLASVKYPDGNSIGYLYNESDFTWGNNLPGVMTGVIDEKGGVMRRSHISLGAESDVCILCRGS